MAENTNAPTVEELKNELEAVKNELASEKAEKEKAIAERDTALKSVEEISGQLALQAKVTESNKLVVTIGKAKYFLTGAIFNIPGKGKLTAEELSKDSDALEMLLKKKSECLRKAE